MFVPFFIFGGGDFINTLVIIAGFWNTPDLLKYPVIIVFLVLTWLAWQDYKSQH
jgi:hypothetical protein